MKIGRHAGTENSVCPKQLEMGIKVEKEHTDDEAIAKQIALDHLAEVPDYYTRLHKMESEAKKSKEPDFKKIVERPLKKSK